MEIKSSNINISTNSQDSKTSASNQESGTKFSDELKELEATKQEENVEDVEQVEEPKNVDIGNEKEVDSAIEKLNLVVKELNQSDENKNLPIKDKTIFADKDIMINNEYNIQEKELLPQMTPNMNFNGNNQSFSSFMDDSQEGNNAQLAFSAKDLAEEASVLSTMSENIALANKNMVMKDSVSKTVPEVGVPFDSILMNVADVEVFAELVQKGEVNINTLSFQNAIKSVQISKTLADMLAKSMENNQPLRIDFDNNISVIIKVSRDGKISADFLPSSQIAEAYLKENLPLLRQRFDESNIGYDSLNQRERREHQRDKQQKERSQ